MTLERPVLFPVNTRFTGAFPETVELSIHNYGRSAGILERVYVQITITIKEDKSVRAANARTDSGVIGEMIGEGKSLGPLRPEFSHPIDEYMTDINNGALLAHCFMTISYSSPAGEKYDLLFNSVYLPEERRFRREHHQEMQGDYLNHMRMDCSTERG